MPSQQRQITEGNIPSYYSVMVYDDANDRRFAKRIMQNASTALRVPVRCEEISLQRWSEGAGAERWIAEMARRKILGARTCNGESPMPRRPNLLQQCRVVQTIVVDI